MKPLKFGDLVGKAKAEEEHRQQAEFEAEVREAAWHLSNFSDLPPIPGSGTLRDYPPVVQRFSIYVLEEANRRERARREK